ncbi:MAG: molybdopterin-dependent oxidoreductase [Planctomycetota bacterium]
MTETSAMSSLRIDGLVGKPQTINWQDLADFPATVRVADISQLGAKRRGEAVRLAAILELVAVSPDATYIGLHATRDDFHASIPLASVRDRALVVYALDGQPLTLSAGGPFRFFIPDHQACHTHEIDECANVKYVDWIELTRERGHDNRPQDDASHAALHQK